MSTNSSTMSVPELFPNGKFISLVSGYFRPYAIVYDVNKQWVLIFSRCDI